MKIIREPEVYLIGKQVVQEGEMARFLSDLGFEWESDSEVPAEILTETAGRLCYLSFKNPRPGGNSKYLEHIKESGHGSVLEHSVYNLIITGVSRSLTHELVRHRAGLGFSQLSQRYVDESTAEYVEPDIIAEDPELHEVWQESVQFSHDAYVRLSDMLARKLAAKGVEAPQTELRKTSRQAARSVLPNATETKIFVTANGRALRHFMEQRGSRYAETEIRKLAYKIYNILVKESPNLFGDYGLTPLADGTFEIVTQYRKV